MLRKICLLLCILLFSGCSILPSELNTNISNNVEENYLSESSMTSKLEESMFDTIFGDWVVSEFLGTLGVHTDEENENDVVGGKMQIGIDGIYVGDQVIIKKPRLKTSQITYDDFFLLFNSSPDILGIEADKIYDRFGIFDEESQFDVVSLIKVNDNELIYYRYTKFYKLTRDSNINAYVAVESS